MARDWSSTGQGELVAGVGFTLDEQGSVVALLADGQGGTLEAFDCATGEPRFTRPIRSEKMRVVEGEPMRFTSNGGELLFAAYASELDQGDWALFSERVDFADVRVLRRVTLTARDWWSGFAMCVGARVACVITGYGDSMAVELRSLLDGAQLGRFTIGLTDDEPSCLALSPDERTVLVGTRRGVIYELSVDPPPPAFVEP